jgi:hypothetical protein
MRKILGGKLKKTVLAVLLSMTFAVGGMAPAHADSCVSSSEFGKLRNGMTEAQVKSLTGTNGTVVTAAGSGKYRIVIKSYKACTKYGAVSLGFMGGKMNSKSGIF